MTQSVIEGQQYWPPAHYHGHLLLEFLQRAQAVFALQLDVSVLQATLRQQLLSRFLESQSYLPIKSQFFD